MQIFYIFLWYYIGGGKKKRKNVLETLRLVGLNYKHTRLGPFEKDAWSFKLNSNVSKLPYYTSQFTSLLIAGNKCLPFSFRLFETNVMFLITSSVFTQVEIKIVVSASINKV